MVAHCLATRHTVKDVPFGITQGKTKQAMTLITLLAKNECLRIWGQGETMITLLLAMSFFVVP